MKEFVTLDITSFRGSIGGEHYYGTLHVQTKYDVIVKPDGQIMVSMRGGFGAEKHPHDRHELKRPVSAKEAAYLNKKDNQGYSEPDPFALKRGDLVNRFNDQKSVIELAKAEFVKLFDDDDVLVMEGENSGDKVFLAGPEHLRPFFDLSYREREKALIADGYLIKPDQYETYRRACEERDKRK